MILKVELIGKTPSKGAKIINLLPMIELKMS